jgi:hypothetical protein
MLFPCHPPLNAWVSLFLFYFFAHERARTNKHTHTQSPRLLKFNLTILLLPLRGKFNHEVKVIGGVREEENAAVLSHFFRKRRRKGSH